MRVSRDAKFLNSISNHPDVYKWICGPMTEPFDTTQILNDEGNVFLAFDDGGFVFLDRGDGLYELHTQFLPDKKTNVVEACKEALQYMFTHGASEVVTYIPTLNKPALFAAMRAGFMYDGDAGEWPICGEFYPLMRYKIDKVSLCH
jgi:RimJ/RimL family protein N-acetyltransferase